MSKFSWEQIIDRKRLRRKLVNDVLPRRLKLAVVASGVINHPRYKRYALELARANSDIDYGRVKAFLDKHDYRNAWSELYYPAIGERVEALSEIEFHCVIEYSLNHILYCDKVNGQKDYKSLELDFPSLPTVAFIRKGQLYASDGKTKVPLGEAALEALSIDPDRDYIAKPAGLDSGAGRAVTVVPGRDLPGRLQALSRLSTRLIVQQVFRGHEFFRSLNPTSLNTLRCVTLKDGDRPRLLSAVLRVGRQGRVTDNFDSGGIAIGVDDRGRLKDRAVDNILRAHRQHPDTGLAFAGLQIPHYQAMIDTCLEAHSRLRNLGVLSWDMALSQANAPVIVEVNCAYQSINLHQAANPGCLLPLSPYDVGWWERMKRVWSRYPTNSDLQEPDVRGSSQGRSWSDSALETST